MKSRNFKRYIYSNVEVLYYGAIYRATVPLREQQRISQIDAKAKKSKKDGPCTVRGSIRGMGEPGAVECCLLGTIITPVCIGLIRQTTSEETTLTSSSGRGGQSAHQLGLLIGL